MEQPGTIINANTGNPELDFLKQNNYELSLKLKAETEKYKIIANDSNAGLWEYDIATKTVYQDKKLNGKWSQNNLTVENFRETILGWGLIYPDDIGIFEAYCDSMDNGEAFFEYDLRAIGDTESFAWFRYIGTTIYDDEGKPYRVVGKTLDVTMEKNENADRQRKVNIDPLTHLFNRNGVKVLIEKALETTVSKKACHMLIILNINNFKDVNNRWGHLYGDYVLEACATRIQGTFSSTDIIGRLGGDEYVIFCPDITNPDTDPPKIIRRLLNRVCGISLKDNSTISVSIGVSMFPKHGITYEALYRCADIALYQAKRTAGSSYIIYSRFVTYDSEITDLSFKKNTDVPMEIGVKHLVDIEKNLFDFAFDVISMNPNFINAVYLVFSEIGKYYDIDKICFIEKNLHTHKVSMLKSWSNNNDYSSDEKLVDFYIKNWNEVESRFYNGNAFYEYHCSENENEANIIHRDKDFLSLNISSVLQFPILDGSQLVAVINFEDRKNIREWTENEKTTISSIIKIISSYMLRLRSKSELEDEILYTGNAMDSQMLTYYVINPKTHIIKYISRYARVLFPDIKVGEKCYQTVMGLNSPCSMCPVLGLNNGIKKYTLETYSEKYDGWFSATASVVERGDKPSENLICWIDVTAFLERVKAKDHLTGALSFEKFKAVALKKIIENDTAYSVSIVGIRHFSRINEEFGYTVGDIVLKTAAECLNNILKEDELICRIKGDDFILLLNNKNTNENVNIFDRMGVACLSLEIMMREKYPKMNIRCVGGIYSITSDDYSITTIIDKTNIARHKAGEYFTNETHNFIEYDSDTESQLMEERALEQIMDSALKQKQFKVYFQPKVNMSNEEICGAEALVRWIVPDGQFIPNYKFIPLFEKNGFIVELDKYVYNETLKLMRKWLDEGKNVPLISVNVSRLHLFDEEFPDYLVGLTEKYNIPRELVEIEITESVFFDNTDRLIEMISKLRGKGFIISMDDFGTGYSTLSLMKSLPIDIIKIDSSFFLNSDLDEKNKAIISSIIHLSQKLNLKIVSEGIETAEQVKFIKSENCDYAQGYHYYRPICHEEFEVLI